MSGLRIALFVSLAVNLLLLGVFGGAALSEWRGQRERGEAAVARSPNMRAVLGALPPERAAAIRERVIETWRDARAERRGAREARMALLRVVSAETYDIATARAAFAQMRVADAAVAERFHEVVADAMASMTVEERRQLLRQLAQRRAEGRPMRPLAPMNDPVEPAPPPP